MRRTWKTFLSLLLVFAMVLSLGTVGFALDGEEQADPPVEETAEEAGGNGVELPFEKVDNDIISERLPLAHEEVEEEEPTYADDEIVRVSIVLYGASALDAGYAPASAGAYRAGLRAEQEAMAQRISAQALGGAQLDVVWNLTLAGNIISANVEYGQIEAIRNVIGVYDVFQELRYYPTEDEVQNINATEMTGATAAWNLGYTGAGSKIAIVDTGLDTDHQSFDAAAFEYAIDELNETRETPVQLMTENDVGAVWDQLNAAQWLDMDGVYRDAKVPYGVNYVDRDYDITHDNDAQGEHGSHVAGIAAANKYIPGANGYDKALETVLTQGEAPDAQLLIMKVFGKGGGAYDSDYMAAIEDAMTLGCDAVNLSLGSSVAGYTTNDTYAELLDKLVQYGLVWCNSAGNNYSWTHFSTGDHYLYADDVNYQTGGSPATYHNSLSVASVDNKGQVGYSISASDGTTIFYTETSGYGNAPMSSIPGEYPYVLIYGPGVADNDYSGNSFEALGSEILEGKIAICQRGSSSFFVKANAAIAQGAVAAIIFNNQAGTISMNLTGYEYTAPVVSITQNEGVLLARLGEKKEANGVTYYEGTLTVNDTLAASNVGLPTSPVQTMSSFSSWGGNGALTMKPEITAPGGNIWSVNGLASPDGYEIMSGTSMASPQVAGLVAVLKQYIREEGLAEKLGLTERAIAQSLLMSTSMPLFDDDGSYWSIMKQGSGLADVNAAINARSFIQITGLPASAPESAQTSIADGKVKVEVGEVDNGFFTQFTVTNITDEDMSLYLNGEFFTQWIYGGSIRTEYTQPVFANISWTVDGQAYRPASLLVDFNNDGVSNSVDAQTLLNWCADDTTEIYNLEYADLDGDGNVDTADARIAFMYLNGAALELAAGQTSVISASVSYDMSSYDEFNGNYIEGFLFVREGDTNDGALGIEHSIPVFGYNGRFSDATMFDRGSLLEYKYEFGDGESVYPYQYYGDLGESALEVETWLVKYAAENGNYYFGGNPLIDDETYHPERNALNSADELFGVRFTQIRNAGASRFFVTDKYDRVVKGSEMEGGPSYATYYYQTAGAWQQTTSTAGVSYTARNAKEGDELTAHYQLALEYYVNSDGSVRWDDLGAGSELTIPFVIDNTAPDIVKVYRDSTAAPGQDEFETPVNEADASVNEEDETTPVADDPEPTEEPEEDNSTDTLEIITHDNQYIAAVALFTDQGELLDAKGALEDTIRGKEAYYSFDLKEIFGEEEVYPYLLVQVYDYALNLSTYKVNFVDDLENAEVESVTVIPAQAVVIGTGSIRLSVDVRPWGIDDAVEWSSSDESIATVDDNGVVTGVTEGFVTITATSLLDPTKSGTSEVQVKFIDKELNGIVWDENGQVWFSDFNLKTIPAYEKLNAENLRLPIASAAYDENGVLYAASFDSDEMVSSLYTIDESTWTATEIGPSEIGYMDLAASPNLDGMMLACYGPYIVIVDKASGDYFGVLNMTNYLDGNNIIGVAYAESFLNTYYNLPVDWIYFLDTAGNLYETGLIAINGGISRFNVYNDGNLGYSCDLPYFQSLYCDGINLYWSCFNQSTNKVDVIMVDFEEGGAVYNTGSFADNVWPVGGLYEQGVILPVTVDPENIHSAEQIDPSGVLLSEFTPIHGAAPAPDAEPNEEPAEEEEEEGTIEIVSDEPGGTLNFVPVDFPGDAETNKISTEVVVNITADELMYNGKIEIDFDPTTATLVEAKTTAQYTGILDRSEDLGHYVLAWVDLNGIPADGLILTLLFSEGSEGTVTITTYEENFNDSDTEDAGLPREQLVILGSATVPEDHEHAFELDHWNWAEDFSSAVAVFKCAQEGAAKCYEAEIEVLVEEKCEETGKITYTASVEVDGQTYTDVKEATIQPAGHDWGEPTWTWEGIKAAKASFVCKRDETHTVTLDAEVVASGTETGAATFTATVEFEGKTYTDVKTGQASATVVSASLNIGDVFSVRLFIVPSEELLADADAYVMLNEKKVLLTDAEKSVKDGVTRYVFSYDIGPKVFNDDVNLKIYDGQDNELILMKKNGTILPDGISYKAQTYINNKMNSSDEKLAALVKAMNDLGHCAQVFFNYKVDTAAPLVGDLSAVTADDVANFAVVVDELNPEKLTYYATSMLLQKEIKIKQYYTLPEGADAAGLTFFINGVEVQPVIKGSSITVTSGNIPAKNFDVANVFEVKDQDGTVILRTQYSVFSYVNSAFEKAADNEDLLNLAKSLFLYGNAAKAYFAK